MDSEALPDVELDAGHLLETAIAETGLEDFGDAAFRPALAQLVDSLNTEAALNAIGRHMQYQRILNSLKNIMVGKTTIIISHRVSSAKLADNILVIDDGEIIEKGSHDILIAQNGVYKELYDKQLQMDEMVEE
jgi:ATP-binding cassette subfamily B protein